MNIYNSSKYPFMWARYEFLDTYGEPKQQSNFGPISLLSSICLDRKALTSNAFLWMWGEIDFRILH